MRFYLDENLSPTIARQAGEHGLEVSCSFDAGNNGLPDDAQLKYAATNGFVLVSRDYADFEKLAKYCVAQEVHHAGIALLKPSLRPTDFGGILRALAALAAWYPEGLADVLVYVDPAEPE